ncbi:Pectinesterase/pectinesterase inhibitor [Spatholobus suberectus]|nr:Pectinesterase/pectinesterase inhibitor [Spatholobus suberectus]
MTTQESLLDKPRKSVSKTIWFILSIAVVLCSSALIGSYLIKSPSFFHHSFSHHVCDHALDIASCLAHVSEVAQDSILTTTKDHKFNLLHSFLMKSTSRIQSVMNTANAIKLRINSPRDDAALQDCVEMMDLSIDRVWDSMVALTKETTDSLQDAHTWLSSVLTNHATCLDGLEGPARVLMEAMLQDLISRARTSLAVLVNVLPPKVEQIIDETLNGDFPSWVTSKDRRLLESSAGDVKANVVVAKDGSGNFKTLAEAVASAPDKAAVGDGFIAQDIWFQNTAGPQKHQAVALRVGADQSIINRCRIDAFQDTLYAHSNRQFYHDSFITGTIDFIFGNAAVVFQKCKLVARKPMNNQNNMITAQGRVDPNQNSGTSIQQCDLTPSSDLKPVVGSFKTFLAVRGRTSREPL